MWLTYSVHAGLLVVLALSGIARANARRDSLKEVVMVAITHHLPEQIPKMQSHVLDAVCTTLARSCVTSSPSTEVSDAAQRGGKPN